MPLGHLPWSLAEAYGDAPAVADDREALTFVELDRRSRAVAEQLQGLGVGPRDVVAVMLPNRVELLLCLFAAWRLGAAVTPVNPAFTADEAAHQVADAGAAVLVHLPDAPHCGAVRRLCVDSLAREPSGELPPVPLSGDEIALLVYTSGSTGRPKGVMLDHDNAEAMSATMVEHFGLTEQDHCLLVLPLFHVNALMVSTLAPLRAGGRLTVARSFSPAGFFDDVERLRPTYFSAVPTIYALLAALPSEVQPDTSSLRFVVCGAAPVSRELLEVCERRYGFRMVEGYGLTEGTCASACNPVDGLRKLGTVGPALPGQRIAVVDTDGRHLPTGRSGEVLISGPTVMRGYLGRPDETADAFLDGWLRTGDVGQLDEDGYLRIVDRIKDVIIRAGENLYPKEIEATLSQVEGVLEAAVVGRPHPVYGEVPVAYVVGYPGAALNVEALLEHCAQRLTRVKVPVELTVVPSLPRNPVGKVDKPALRRLPQPV